MSVVPQRYFILVATRESALLTFKPKKASSPQAIRRLHVRNCARILASRTRVPAPDQVQVLILPSVRVKSYVKSNNH
jgi:hypothetical protein